jgi:hypothetical protein
MRASFSVTGTIICLFLLLILIAVELPASSKAQE